MKIDMDNLKISKKKSKYLSEVFKSYFKGKGDVAEVESEVEFIDGKKDCIDVELRLNEIRIIIEIDNLRADQVIKKVLSRTAAFSQSNFIYITFCYDSKSAKGHKSECLKYIDTHLNNYFKVFSYIEYIAFVPTKHI